MLNWLRRKKKDTWIPFKTVTIDKNQSVKIIFDGTCFTLDVDKHGAILNANNPLATICELRYKL